MKIVKLAIGDATLVVMVLMAFGLGLGLCLKPVVARVRKVHKVIKEP